MTATDGRQPASLRQAHWGVISQGLNTATSFVLALVVARSVAPEVFGAFAIVFVGYVLAVGVVRTTGNGVLTITYAADPATLPAAARDSTGYALGVGSVGGAAALAVGAVLDGPTGAVLLVLGAALPLLLVQAAVRGLFVAQGRPRSAAANDALWLGMQVAGTTALLALVPSPTMWALVAAWAGAGALAGLAGLAAAGVLPRLRPPHRWFAAHRTLATPMLGTLVLEVLPAQAVFLIVPLAADLAETGVLRATYILYGPLGTLFAGVCSLALVDAVRSGTGAGITRVTARVSAALGATAVVWGTVVVALPAPVGRLLMGPTWDLTAGARVFLGLTLVAEGLLVGATVAMGAFRMAERIVGVQFVAVPLMLGAAFVLAAPYGAAGAAAGLALGYGVAVGLLWAQVPAAARRYDALPATTPPT